MPIDKSDVFVPEMWAGAGLDALANTLKLGSIVNRDFENEVAQSGDTVNVQKPIQPTILNKAKGTDYTDGDADAENIPLKLTRQPYWTHVFEDADRGMSFKNLEEVFLRPAVQGIGEQIENDVASLFSGFTTVVSDYSTSLTEALVAEAKAKLTINKAPDDDNRFFVYHPDAGIDILTMWNLMRDDAVGDGGVGIRNGIVGTKFGTHFVESQLVPELTANELDNCMMHRNAIGLAVRPLPPVNDPGVSSAVVNAGGYSIRVVRGYDVRAGGVRITVETLYGVVRFYDELGVKLRSLGV